MTSPHVTRAILDELGDIPHLRDAGCRTDDGFVAMTIYMEGRQGQSPGVLAAARRVCDRLCPLRTKAACLAWVMTSEKSAGSWGGIYAGRTPGERMKEWGAYSTPERHRAARLAVTEMLGRATS